VYVCCSVLNCGLKHLAAPSEKKNTKHAIAAAIEALSKLLPKEVRDFQQEAIRSHIVDSSDNTHNT